MTLTPIIPFVPFFFLLFRPLAHWLEQAFRALLRPHPAALVRGALTDLTYTKAELIAENALLRHQLAILHRQVKRPQLNRRERFGLLVLASHVRNWRDALLIIQPETLLRWLRLFWRWRSNAFSMFKNKNNGLAGSVRLTTAPLKGLFSHQKGGFYHDGRFPDLRSVVDHYDSNLKTRLTDDEKADLIAYLRTL